jgi:hypothetical protein
MLKNQFLATDYKVSIIKYLKTVCSKESNCTIAKSISKFQETPEKIKFSVLYKIARATNSQQETAGFGSTTKKKLNPVDNHVSLTADPCPADPSTKTQVLTNTLPTALSATPKQITKLSYARFPTENVRK